MRLRRVGKNSGPFFRMRSFIELKTVPKSAVLAPQFSKEETPQILTCLCKFGTLPSMSQNVIQVKSSLLNNKGPEGL